MRPRLNRLSIPFPTTDTSKIQRNLQDDSVFKKFNGTSLVLGHFSRISPGGKNLKRYSRE